MEKWGWGVWGVGGGSQGAVCSAMGSWQNPGRSSVVEATEKRWPSHI